ncbi:hypothetical protein [Brevibacillus sp. SIMBA_040]|uniref:hypothetical protein n=1 Tax=Brevibacillus sp. SIMBA_040 TaxID=3085781 RepID=UPI00397C849D
MKHIGMVILFLAFLLAIRWMWYSVHATPEHPFVSQGVIDLRGWDTERFPDRLAVEWDVDPENQFAYSTADDSAARRKCSQARSAQLGEGTTVSFVIPDRE